MLVKISDKWLTPIFRSILWNVVCKSPHISNPVFFMIYDSETMIVCKQEMNKLNYNIYYNLKRKA